METCGNQRLAKKDGGEIKQQWNHQRACDPPLRPSIGGLCEREPFIRTSINQYRADYCCVCVPRARRRK